MSMPPAAVTLGSQFLISANTSRQQYSSTDVYLTWMAVGDDGAIALADALLNNENSAVRILHMSWNNVSSSREKKLAVLFRL